jgi:hypothetical protein
MNENHDALETVAAAIWNSLNPRESIAHFGEMHRRHRGTFLKAAHEAITTLEAHRNTLGENCSERPSEASLFDRQQDMVAEQMNAEGQPRGA